MKSEMTLDEYRAWLAEQKQPPAPRDDREHQEQVALFEWAARVQPRIPELALLFAIPNGSARHPVVASKLKAEGVKAGVLDIFLPVARRMWHGLWLELKAPGGRMSDEQLEWAEALKAQGYAVDLSYGWQEAARKILAYLGYVPEEYGL